ncbi:MAG TPA: tRNA pseudouridine(55) synthase TruB [Candidatus Saccharimonadales bacterium]|nr:tRNA pseudouridine(55) synthase TruB [Candidatus Saccharimonadales bacterium]
MQNPSGIILIDKPSGMTSFGVVARVRRRLSEVAGKKVKVGHTGTLDPFATGLMIIVAGKYTKRAGDFSKLDKTYDATIILGKTSTTGDPEGEISEISNKEPSLQEVKTVLAKFTGEIEQTPPIYSAIKINGQRAYNLARKGVQVDMPVRKVKVYNLDLVEYNYPEMKIRTHVSSGTYIRTLTQDIGGVLQTGAYTSELRRTVVGKFKIEQAQTIADEYRLIELS